MPTDKTNKTLGLLALAGLTPYEEKKGEEYMNEKQMEHFRLLLRAWRDQLRQEVDRTVHHMQDEAANFPDPVNTVEVEDIEPLVDILISVPVISVLMCDFSPDSVVLVCAIVVIYSVFFLLNLAVFGPSPYTAASSLGSCPSTVSTLMYLIL